jgi:hypothetical protein
VFRSAVARQDESPHIKRLPQPLPKVD